MLYCIKMPSLFKGFDFLQPENESYKDNDTKLWMYKLKKNQYTIRKRNNNQKSRKNNSDDKVTAF